MKKMLFLLLLVFTLTIPVSAQEYTVPEAPKDAQQILPADRDTFGEGLWYVLRSAFVTVQPQLLASGKIALSVIAVAMITGLLGSFEGSGKRAVGLAGMIVVSCLLLQPTGAQIASATQTIHNLSDYGKMLIPVMAAALAAQGGAVTSAALYSGTIVFDAILSTLIYSLLVPMVYIYLVLSVVHCALGNETVKRIRDILKSLMTWSLKILLYTFTAYIGITGVVSGTTDQAALKAAKLTISGMVPVIGSILSDASEAVLVGAGVVKNAAGIAGMLVVIAIVIVPFLQIGIQYLSLKLTGAICTLFPERNMTTLVEDFSTAMGFLLGAIGAMCLMFLISLVCFLKGVG